MKSMYGTTFYCMFCEYAWHWSIDHIHVETACWHADFQPITLLMILSQHRKEWGKTQKIHSTRQLNHLKIFFLFFVRLSFCAHHFKFNLSHKFQKHVCERMISIFNNNKKNEKKEKTNRKKKIRATVCLCLYCVCARWLSLICSHEVCDRMSVATFRSNWVE